MLHIFRGSPTPSPHLPASDPACAHELHCTTLVLLHQHLPERQREARSLERCPQSVLPPWHPHCSTAEQRVQPPCRAGFSQKMPEGLTAVRKCCVVSGERMEPAPSQRCLGTHRGTAGMSCSRETADKEKILPLSVAHPWDRTQGDHRPPSLEIQGNRS